jgi:hypothetical protein
MRAISAYPFFNKIHRLLTSNLFILILFSIVLCQISYAQAPPGYILCSEEGDSYTLPARSDVAYGAQGKYNYLYNQSGTIKFNNVSFGGDPLPGVRKFGYYKIVDINLSINSLTNQLDKIKKHVVGSKILPNTEIIKLTDSIRQNIFSICDTSSLVLLAFDIVTCYDSIVGPLFISNNTKNGFPMNFAANDGHELARAIFIIQQGIHDYVYTAEKYNQYQQILSGRKFKTSDYFPGKCPLPENPLQSYSTKINATMEHEYGKRTAWSSTPVRRPTGYYLAPGTVGKITVPPSMVNQGFEVLIGAHTFDRKGNSNGKRLFRVSNSFPITQTVTEIINPFGGGIYIVTPYEANLGIQEIQLTNVVPAPFFSYKSFEKTTNEEWVEKQRNNKAPWADLESDKYMMQVPTAWIYNYDDPTTLMEDWDNRMDIISKLLGYPLKRNHPILYLSVDVDIMHNGFYGIGNPQINNTYNPYAIENGNNGNWILRPGSGFFDVEFHEMGHAQLFSKFPGETEAAVNLLAAALYNRLYKFGIDTSFGKSFFNQPYISRDQAAMNWMVTPNFRAGKPMNISNTTKDEVRYQHRGWGKYIEMANLFGWESIDSFYRRENIDFINNEPSDILNEVDSRILRFSQSCGADVRPLIHLWGVHPSNNDLLQNKLDAVNLKPSKLICNRLEHYQSIIPKNNTEFFAHAKTFLGGSIPSGGDPDYGSGWYNVWLPLYNETHGIIATNAMQNIIDFYFPSGCPIDEEIPVLSVNSPSICIGDSVTLTVNGATYYQWDNSSNDQNITVSPLETTAYTVIGRKAGYESAPTIALVTVNPIPTITVRDTSTCKGDSITLTASGALNYTWSTGQIGESIQISPENTVSLSVTGTSFGCTNSSEVSITVNELPNVNLGIDTLLTAGQEILLDAGENQQMYLWSTGDTSRSILIDSPGTYSVIVSNSFGCINSDTIIVSLVSSNIDESFLNPIAIFPNPIFDVVQVRSKISISEILVMDLEGIVKVDVKLVPRDEFETLINLAHLPSGAYYMRIKGKLLDKIFKIVKI